MDDREKKLLAQLDSDIEAVRNKAASALHDYQQSLGRSCVQIVFECETAVQNYAAKVAELAQYQAALGQWQQSHATLTRQVVALKAIAWGVLNWRRLAGSAVVALVISGAWAGYQRFWPWPAAVDAGLQRIAAASPWGPGCGHVAVREVAGNPYWVLLCGQTDTASHATAEGAPVGLHCLHLYAHAAEADAGEYVKANPYALFGWLIKWPERAVQCEPFPLKEAQN
jgi:hypothetical protein